MKNKNFNPDLPSVLSFRTTEKNKRIIENLCQEKKLTKSAFLREMLNFLNSNYYEKRND